jgi:molybdate transport system substrate-binding protein
MRAWLVAFMVAFSASTASSAEIRVMAAGSLKDAFAAIFADYTKQYGGSFAPVWARPVPCASVCRTAKRSTFLPLPPLPHAQALTEAGVSGPSVLFTRNALCIVTDAAMALDSGNLVETLLKPDIRIGTSTPVADPAGDYTWEIFHRIDAQRPGAFKLLSEKAQQLFGGAATTTPVNGRPRLLVALDEHQIDLFIYYCSGAREIVKASAKYKSIELPPELSVGPEYGLTVSRKASPSAADFAMYLLSPRGQASLKAFGFIPVALPAVP